MELSYMQITVGKFKTTQSGPTKQESHQIGVYVARGYEYRIQVTKGLINAWLILYGQRIHLLLSKRA